MSETFKKDITNEDLGHFMNSNFKTPLAIYILYDKENTNGNKIYDHIYHLLCRNSNRPLEDGLNIPVFFRTNINNRITPIDTNLSNKNVVLLLVDSHMYLHTEIWNKYIDELLIKQSYSKLKIFAVKLHEYAFEINRGLQQEQFICLKNNDIESDWSEFKIRLYDNILRYLLSYEEGQKLKLFISHAKTATDESGKIIATSLRDYLRSNTKLDSFFDVNDIADGTQFAQQIQSNIASSLLVIIESDAYSAREWCRIEAISGKKNIVPSVLVNISNGVVPRTFPYLGNMPKIRFNNNWDEVIILLLRTALNWYYENEYLWQLIPKCALHNTVALPAPPELLNLIYLNEGIRSILYPEPPLGCEELEILKRNGKIDDFFTPSQLYSRNNKLQNLKIAISVSDTPEFLELGIGKVMFDDFSVELARHLLIAGAQLVYGGDLRDGGFTKLFCDLSCQYGLKEHANWDATYFTNYFPWPVYNKLTEEDEVEFKHDRVKIEKTGIPERVNDNDKNKFIEPTTPNGMFLWASSLSIMRERMENDVDARILLGGRIVGFKGRMAGIFEEAVCAVRKKHPIYLLGGFGGASAQITRLMKGGITARDLFEQAKIDDKYKQLIDYCRVNGLAPINYDNLEIFENKGYEILNNGLSEDENEILFNSINIVEIISLILKGLSKVLTN